MNILPFMLLFAAAAEPVDAHSHARPEEVRVKHVSLDLTLDFERQQAVGRAALDLERSDADAPLKLDVRGLDIKRVSDSDGRVLAHRLGEAREVFGAPLTVPLAPGVSRVVVEYVTGAEADALQWLLPEQTLGRAHPYLFTQGQAILTRTWIPLQDTPGVRVTYDATIRAPADLVVVMSAERKTPKGLHPACVDAGVWSDPEGVTLLREGAPIDCASPDEEGLLAWRFSMPDRIPPYLIALAAGDLAFRAIDERTGVFCEPGCVDDAAWELADTPKMMAAVERLYGPYRWGRYDVLVLPPSFPYGGMENPRLTFVSPTIIAGDRSLTSIIAHELAHSWSGNLVTNAQWGDLWLNEGFTSYLELRLVEEVYGEARAQLVESLGRRDLLEKVAELGERDPKTALALKLDPQEDPDDGLNSIPYDKGAAFLRLLEEEVGREALDGFLRGYFDDHAFESMTTERALALLEARLLGSDKARAKALHLRSWAFDPGLPQNLPPVQSPLLSRIEAEAARFAKGTKLEALKTEGFGSLEWVLFLRAVPRDLAADKRASIHDHLELSTTKNSELRFEWLKLAVPLDPKGTEASVRAFLTSQGRRRLVKPIYQRLMRTEEGRRIAREVFAEARASYHPLTVASVEAVLEEPPDE